MATQTRTYDPGEPQEVRHIGRGHYAVQSFRKDDEWYAVDLDANLCTCPHTQFRKVEDCKHREAAREEAARQARKAAEVLPIADLRKHLERTDLRPEVRRAIDEVLFSKLCDDPAMDAIVLPAVHCPVEISETVIGEDGKFRLVFPKKAA